MNLTMPRIGIIAAALTLLSFACSASHDQIVLINKSKSWRGMMFTYWSPTSTVEIGYQQTLETFRSDTASFAIAIPTTQPLFLNFAWNFQFQIVCLFPGDTLEFTKTDDKFPFVFGGTRPKNELSFFTSLEKEGMGVLSGNMDVEVTSRLHYQYIADRSLEKYDHILRLVDERNVVGAFTKEGRQAIEQSIYYRYLGELLFPYHAWQRVEEIGSKSKLVPEQYKAKLRELRGELGKDSLMYLLDYRRFVLQYARFMMAEDSHDDMIRLPDLLGFYKKTFRGKIRDCLLFDEIQLNFLRNSDASLVDVVIDSIEDPSLKIRLIGLQEKFSGQFSQHELTTEVESPTGEKVSLRQLFSSYTDRLIYMDFWATWCGPCLMEMPDSEKLVREFKNKSIAFVYLSVDEDRARWLAKIPSLPNGGTAHHYRVLNSSAFLKEIGREGVPIYMLIGKDGKVITTNAPRPRSSEIRQLIEDHIERRK